MNILLINLPLQVGNLRRKRYSHLLGLRYIASSLIANGHKVQIQDYQNYTVNFIQETPSEEIKRIASEILSNITCDISLVGISVPFTSSSIIAHQVIDEIKIINETAPIVIGGMYPSSFPQMALKSEADYIVVGEGEQAMVELVEYLENGCRNILPHYILRKGDIQINNKPCIISDLDNLPFPVIDDENLKDYTKNTQRNILDARSTCIITSRGCPYNCDFCNVHSLSGYNWRARTPSNVLEEINLLISKWSIANLEFEDDNFSLDKERCLSILEGLFKLRPNITWTAPNGLRIDSLDEELIRLFKKTNCRYVFLALEHGDDHVLNKIINKKSDLGYIEKVIRLFKKYDIKSYINVIYAYPGESNSRFKNSLNYYRGLKKINPSIEFSFMLPEPYPGTELWERTVKNGWVNYGIFKNINTMFDFYHSSGPWILNDKIGKETVLKRSKILFDNFHTTQTYIEGYCKYPPLSDH